MSDIPTQLEVDKLLCAGNGAVKGTRRRKVEVLTANYDIGSK